MEYKFRGKRIDNGKWAYGNLIYDNISDKYWIDLSINESEKINGGLHIYAVEVMPETVGQYTGLKDKNGKEIYSGDIVKVKHLNAIYAGTVKFDEEYCEYRIELVDAYINLWKKLENIEVIGNTTDNPELLKEE